MLERLCFWVGGGAAEARVVLYLVNEHEGFSQHFDAAKQLKYDRWRLLYLARHGRIEPPYFEAMASREVDEWIEEVSEMLKAESGAVKKARGG